MPSPEGPLWIRRGHIMTCHEMSWHIMIMTWFLAHMSSNVTKYHQMSPFVDHFHSECYHQDVIKCQEMSFNLTWWHLITWHDMSWCGQSDSEREYREGIWRGRHMTGKAYDGESIWRGKHMTGKAYDGEDIWRGRHMIGKAYDGEGIWRGRHMTGKAYDGEGIWWGRHMTGKAYDGEGLWRGRHMTGKAYDGEGASSFYFPISYWVLQLIGLPWTPSGHFKSCKWKGKEFLLGGGVDMGGH